MCLEQRSVPARNEAACWPGTRPQLPICRKGEKAACVGWGRQGHFYRGIMWPGSEIDPK